MAKIKQKKFKNLLPDQTFFAKIEVEEFRPIFSIITICRLNNDRVSALRHKRLFNRMTSGSGFLKSAMVALVHDDALASIKLKR